MSSCVWTWIGTFFVTTLLAFDLKNLFDSSGSDASHGYTIMIGLLLGSLFTALVHRLRRLYIYFAFRRYRWWVPALIVLGLVGVVITEEDERRSVVYRPYPVETPVAASRIPVSSPPIPRDIPGLPTVSEPETSLPPNADAHIPGSRGFEGTSVAPRPSGGISGGAAYGEGASAPPQPHPESNGGFGGAGAARSNGGGFGGR